MSVRLPARPRLGYNSSRILNFQIFQISNIKQHKVESDTFAFTSVTFNLRCFPFYFLLFIVLIEIRKLFILCFSNEEIGNIIMRTFTCFLVGGESEFPFLIQIGFRRQQKIYSQFRDKAVNSYFFNRKRTGSVPI